ncbi:MAG: hypothetical protein RR612_02780 [Oscillospiraceae bacterium]
MSRSGGAAAPTEWGEYGKIALYRGDCKVQLHCKTPTERGQDALISSAGQPPCYSIL